MNRLLLVSGLCLLFTLVDSIQLNGQRRWWAGNISGSGPVVEQSLDLASFEKVSLGVSANLYISQGSTQSITIKGQQNIIDNIISKVEDNTWKIRFDQPVRRSGELKIYVTLPKLSAMRVSGSGSVYGEGVFDQSSTFYTGISGSGNMKLVVQAQEVVSKVSGSGNIALDGEAETYEVQISGSGNVRAEELQATKCQVRISGSGSAEVDVADALEVRISGSGDVYYEGRPKINSRISGSGDLRARD